MKIGHHVRTSVSLVVAGSGIKFVSHLTQETQAYVRQADIVLHLMNDPAMKVWIEQNSQQAEALDHFYARFRLRRDCYRAITEHILATVRKQQHVCVMLYGHPTVFAQPGREAVRRALEEGIDAKILPGISAEDCLFADLLIDPGTVGCQSFEATDFILHRRRFDDSSHLILWQVSLIGVLDNPSNHDNRNGARCLVNYLSKSYSLDHEVILYEAAQYPSFSATIQRLRLRDLPEAAFSRVATLYIPPARRAVYDPDVLEALNMPLADLIA
ncbi:MAG: SAM-dependent methyltransferase [Gammaproteobacteria bacterium]|nr:SAM-dependent methyltransferase [Gammaproteobacteria bacterium]